MSAWFPCDSVPPRRAAVVVQVAVTLPVLLAFAALVIDVGMLYNTKADLQRAADAAALAGASAYFSTPGQARDESSLVDVVTHRAQQFSLQNPTLGKGTILEEADVALGRHDFEDPTSELLSGDPMNAVEVIVRRTAESANGAVPFFFARIFGRFEGHVTASARAAMDDRFAGYRLRIPINFLPFAIHEDIYEDMLVNGPDEFLHDGKIDRKSDGIPEIRLYPWRLDEVEEVVEQEFLVGGGNFGTLNIGLGSEGSSFLEEQITNGTSPSELEAEFGTTDLVFYDDHGEPVTYQVPGNPGASIAMKSSLNGRLGDVVGFFIYNNVVGSGSNAIYTITGVRFARIMDVHLTGQPGQRALTVQPAPYTDGNIIVDESAPSTNGQIGRVALVQ